MAKEGHIRRMPIELANKIAAGEVVQRPASAVKELLENAIDAKATEIEVKIKSSGSSLIHVSDNGTGMNSTDALQCFERHATSKITSSEDLENIRTLGFRGEALASIAAIAQVSLKTKRKDDTEGTFVRIEGGEVVESSPCATTQGTIVDVRNIFFNVPARRSFLKAPSTEFRHISDVFVSCALANPWTGFKLEHDSKDIFRLIGSRADHYHHALRERIRSILGSEIAQHMVPVDESSSYLSVLGFLSHPEHARKSRKDQHLFVNYRPVKSPSLSHAIRTAFDPVLPEGFHPVFTLFLTIDPHHVDVNVHPSKMEVRFDDDRGVYNFLQSICKRALGVANLIPEHPGDISSLSFQPSSRGNSWTPPPRADELKPAHDQQSSIVYEVEPSRLPVGADPEPTGLLWPLQGGYILTQLSHGIMVVDQSAAHQRILYERTLDDVRNGTGMSQQLLFHQLVCFTEEDCRLLNELNPMASSLGFDYSISENLIVTIRGVPSHIRTGAEKDFLQLVLQGYKDNDAVEGSSSTKEEKLARSVAKHGAMHSSRKLDDDEMRTMIDRLFECKQPYQTPEGKPTLIRMTHDEIKRQFDQRITGHAEPDEIL